MHNLARHQRKHKARTRTGEFDSWVAVAAAGPGAVCFPASPAAVSGSGAIFPLALCMENAEAAADNASRLRRA